jgi:hypothetical protein
VRWIVHGALFVALAVGIFGVLPRLGGLTHEAVGLRHARPAFLVAAVLAQAISLGCYAALPPGPGRSGRAGAVPAGRGRLGSGCA